MNSDCICEKDEKFCLCHTIELVPTRIPVIVLRHPQEKRKATNTACVSNKMFENCEIKTGLSWKNLKTATGRETRNWGVLYPGSKAITSRIKELGPGAYAYKNDQVQIITEHAEFDGIIALDGNWAQSKTLWWRNPWIKRLTKISLNPKTQSVYGNVLKEPRKTYLTTAESIAYLLEILENRNGLLTNTQKHLKELEQRLSS